MGISTIENGTFPWAPTIEALLNYVTPGQGDGITTFGDARTRLNAAATALGLPTIGNDTTAQIRAKINAMIDALGLPSDAVFAYDATTDRILGGSKSFTRSSTALWNPSGDYEEYATNVLRRADGVGAVLEEGRTNKSANYNANPTVLAGVTKSGDAAATLTVVDDSAALAAAGLGGICTSGMVFKLDNSAGTGAANAIIDGATGNTNNHAISAFMRGSGTANVRLFTTSPAGFVLTSGYQRYVNVAAPSSSNSMTVQAEAGAIVYFILNQLEEGSFATTPIITAGATATSAGDELTLTPTSGAALDWHVRYDDDSEEEIASGVSGAYEVDPSMLTRPGVKRIWATEAA